LGVRILALWELGVGRWELTRVLIGALTAALVACGRGAPNQPPSILLVTLDTTRADSIGPDAAKVSTPAFDKIAARGLRFRNAYATVPETLPSHTSLLTGLYPAGHGIHQNGRTLGSGFPTVAEKLHGAGYRTAAFVSAFVLARQFGLARGFDVYDDRMPAGRSERGARETTDAAIAELKSSSAQPRFFWVHYYDPHYPYAPPEPYRSQYAASPYLGEIASMDRELGRLADAFESAAGGSAAVVVVADHGEGLGDHGEAQHGTLLYQSTMHVPLVIAGPGVSAGVSDTAVSTRQVFYTILDWAGLGSQESLRNPSSIADRSSSIDDRSSPIVLGEAMKPFLDYGWQPQVMAVDGRTKAIEAGRLEAYDLAADPGERHDLGTGANLPSALRKAIGDYPLPSTESARAPESLDADARARLASLGYVSAGAAPVIRKDAPRPADMIGLLPTIERASGLFTAGKYQEAIPVLEQVRAADPGNLVATLRLAVCESMTGHRAEAETLFARAKAVAPESPDVDVYLGLHYAHVGDRARAEPLLEKAIARFPDRVPVIEALASLREQQKRPADALALREKLYSLRPPSAEQLVNLGELAMDAGNTQAAIDAFTRARAAQGSAFTHDLDLGVLYMDARRFADARDALDRVPPSSPGYPMALFKRAEVAVLLKELDAPARIELARKKADAVTRPLIEKDRLFRQ
jgi:arylsulfatase A-like enzyme/Flp pilus assembly protein TadD